MSIKELIHKAAEAAEPSFMDYRVYYDRKLDLFELAQKDINQKIYANVPLRNIVALNRDDFWNDGDNWRDAAKHLHCDGWDNDVFDYFENPIEEKIFPAPISSLDLRFLSVGGACVCSNGNHRLVAAKSWLAYKFGEFAVLKSAKISHYPINSVIRSILENAKEKKSDVYILKVNPYDNNHSIHNSEISTFIQLSSERDRIYEISEKSFKITKLRKFIFSNFFCKNNNNFFENRETITIPIQIVCTLLDDSWITKSL